MHGDVSMSLLVSVIFGDVVEVITTNDDGPLHLGADHNTLENLASDGDSASEGAFLVDVLGFNSLFGGLETQSDVLEVPDSCAGLLGEQLLAVEEHRLLLLE